MAGIDYWKEVASFKGVATPVAQLLKEGWATGDDAIIAALDRYAYENADQFINDTLLHLRRIYKKPLFRGSPASDHNLPGGSSSDDTALKDFFRKTSDAQNKILKKSVDMMLMENDMQGNPLFTKKQDWIGIYLVVKAHIEKRITQKDFYPYALKITPDDFPENLRISSGTISNISHFGLPDLPYFMWMEKQLSQNHDAARINTLCERFWRLVMQNTYDIS